MVERLMEKETIEARIQTLENKMYQAAEALQFLEADRLKEMVENLKTAE